MNKLQAKKIVDQHDANYFNTGQCTGAELKEYQEARQVYYGTATQTAADLANFTEGLHVISGTDLIACDFPPLKPTVEGLIYRGNLALLAARPKSGKSWWAFQLAQAVDTGTSFLGRQTTKGNVLYLALEDGDRRIHQRMRIRRWTPQNVAFAFDVAPFTGLQLGIRQIEAASANYDLIIIDTLIATMRGPTDENNNAQMGEILNSLARFAHESGKAVIVVHHTTKGGASEDPFDDIRGAGAIRAAYDVGLVLQRKNKEREAVLRVESRDIDVQDMTILFDGATGWTYEGDASAYEGITAGRKVVKAMAEMGDGKTTEEIAEHMGVTRQAALQQLQKAEGRQLVMRESQPQPGKKSKDLWSRS